MSECRVYMNQRLIGTLSDEFVDAELCLRGVFDYEGVEGLHVVDNTLYLNISDLERLIEIIEHWVDGAFEERWEWI